MSEPDADNADAAAKQRQRVVRVPGSRRARLTPAPGTDPSPDVPPKPAPTAPRGAKGANDDQLLRDVPPHY
ncbi:hypothetical protein MZK47_16190 [Microbacterium aerolatum]|uniref:hypothetical protein n=1 Tax=Microbacterium aerolatum TaxID=153731 RepID=UPI0020018980|nr:hypothetical protein [Microbacterium aerolatum]MCK3771207.1 hypothetical protein [Microbacterium aerolatum]